MNDNNCCNYDSRKGIQRLGWTVEWRRWKRDFTTILFIVEASGTPEATYSPRILFTILCLINHKRDRNMRCYSVLFRKTIWTRSSRKKIWRLFFLKCFSLYG